jgi:hypothetical protein
MFAQAINAAWTDNTSSTSSSSTSSSPLTINVTKETSKNTNKNPNIFDFSFGILGNLFPLVDALKYKFIATSGSDDDSDNSALYSLYTKQSRYSCNVIVNIVSLLFHYCFIIVSDISIVMKFFIDGLQCCDSRGGQR